MRVAILALLLGASLPARAGVMGASVGPSSIDTAKINTDAVTSTKILNGAVNTAKLGAQSVTNSALAPGSTWYNLYISTPGATNPGFGLDANNAPFTSFGSTKAYGCYNIGNTSYDQWASTTTGANTNPLSYATMTVLLSQRAWSRGDRLIVTLTGTLAANGNTKTPHIWINNGSGTLTDIGGSGGTVGNLTSWQKIATLKFLTGTTWENDGFGWTNNAIFGSPPALSNTPVGTISLATTSNVILNGGCQNGTSSAGDCSGLVMSVDFCAGGL